MNQQPMYLTLNAKNWPCMHQQVKAAVTCYWHQHAGHWQPEIISLHVATRLLPDAIHAAQRKTHLPPLVTWLRQQGRMVTVLGDQNLLEHRLYLNSPDNNKSKKMRRQSAARRLSGKRPFWEMHDETNF